MSLSIAISSAKGGTGVSTLARNMAVFLAQVGKSTALVDLSGSARGDGHERVDTAKHAGVQELEQAPQLAQMVLDRRPAHREAPPPDRPSSSRAC